MPLAAPVLDDRTFDDIVAEAKSLIPRYAREWTDHNDSDPGITLIQLFAWMTEMLIFRLNQVPELNYVKFLQLLGIELQPAQPARVDITFTIAAAAPTPVIIVPLGTQLAVAGAPGEPLIFETDRALNALRAPVIALRSFDGFTYSGVEPQNDDPAATFYPFGRHARDGSSLSIGFDATGPFPRDVVDLAVFVPEGNRDVLSHSCQLDMSRIRPPASIVWEFWHKRGEWQPLDLIRDETRAFTRSGRIEFAGPGTDAGATDLGLTDVPLHWIRARLDRGDYETAPKLDAVFTNTIPATQAQTVRDEVIGSTDGRVSQPLFLANVPVVAIDPPESVPRQAGTNERVNVRAVQLEIDEGLGFRVWEQVDDFFASGPDDEHFTLNRTTGEIRLGDGEHGRIPTVSTSQFGGNVVARLYRYGGGRRGNVGGGKVTELQAAVPFVEGATNRRPAQLGADEETIEAAKLRAPQELQNKGRAVTATDFERIAMATPGANVKRAKALPLVHPKFPNMSIPGVVTVIVVPETDAPNPTPNETTLRTVCAYLDKHRLLTSEVHVAPPNYRKIRIEADVVVQPSSDLATVKRVLEDRLAAYLHPLTGGIEQQGWEFGGDVYFSDIAQRIVTTPGVDRIDPNALLIWVDEIRYGPCEDVPILDVDLVYSDGHDIRVAYEARA